MAFPRFILVVLLICAATAGVSGATPVASALLPKQFGGWQESAPARPSSDPAVADPVNATLLKEYGFTDFESATYLRDDGRKLTVKAARFADASGAFGAFSYYRTPEMNIETIGDEAASANPRVMFLRGNVLVDAVFSKLSVMSAAELRELSDALPVPPREARNLPSLPSYLPKQSMVANTTKYVVGPVALAGIGSPIPPALVDFNAGAEVVLSTYKSSGGDATLMLVSYPTPQIAAEHLRRLDAAHAPSTQSSGGPVLLDVGPFFDRRTGPILAIAAGPLSQSEAKSLLASVNYDADVTWNENTHFTKRDNLANLLVNIIILCGILIGLALVAGVAFGGIRILIRRYLPDRFLGKPAEMEFIALHLTEEPRPVDDSKVSPSIKVG